MLYYYYYSYPRISLSETQPKPAACSQVGMILKMHVQSLRYLLGDPKPPIFHVFRLSRHSNANLTANVFGTKRDIENWRGALNTARSSLRSSKIP